MARLFSVRVKSSTGASGGAFVILPLLLERMRDPVRPISKGIAKDIRFGEGSVSDHFSQQGEFALRGGKAPWVRSQAAISERRLTLVDTGALRAAWLDRGAGASTQISKRGVRIGVDRSVIPYGSQYQGVGGTGISSTRGSGFVIPRRILMSKGMVDRVEKRTLRYLVAGQA